MELYHIPEKIQGIVKSYFGGMKIRFTVDDYTTSWQIVEKGIYLGCIYHLTHPIFVMGMGMVTRAAEKKLEGRICSMIFAMYRGPCYIVRVCVTGA